METTFEELELGDKFTFGDLGTCLVIENVVSGNNWALCLNKEHQLYASTCPVPPFMTVTKIDVTVEI